METATAAQCMESLGNPTRLDIYRKLVRAGPSGLNVGQLQAQIELPGSTLSHHLHHLVSRNLVAQTREGRALRCTANYDIMNALLTFLADECCADECNADACGTDECSTTGNTTERSSR